jgi:uncharacterized membrane protein
MTTGGHLRAHPRLLLALAIGVVAALLAPHVSSVTGRALFGWNLGVWFYLATVAVAMWRADQGDVKRVAVRQAESAFAVLVVVTIGAVVAMGAMAYELSAAKQAGGARELWPHVVLAGVTVAGSWLLVPTMFALSYASLYYGMQPGGGLAFPSRDARFEPDYVDFLYYAFTIAVAAQTADVAASTREMRRLTLVQSVLAFAFNTTVLALTVNVAAGLF